MAGYGSAQVALRKLRQGGCAFEVSLGSIERLCYLKKRKKIHNADCGDSNL